MASHFMPLFFAFILVFVPTYGREFKNSYTSEIRNDRSVSHAKPSHTRKTNYNDEHGLIELYSKYPLMLDFISTGGDPCLPTPLSWIQCNSDASPRVIALNLNNRQLSGVVPDFSSMDALQRIDLSDNRFTGDIPSFLGSFSHLQELNLSMNLFSGLVPDSIAFKNKIIKMSMDANYFDQSNSPSVSKQAEPTPEESPPLAARLLDEEATFFTQEVQTPESSPPDTSVFGPTPSDGVTPVNEPPPPPPPPPPVVEPPVGEPIPSTNEQSPSPSPSPVVEPPVGDLLPPTLEPPPPESPPYVGDPLPPTHESPPPPPPDEPTPTNNKVTIIVVSTVFPFAGIAAAAGLYSCWCRKETGSDKRRTTVSCSCCNFTSHSTEHIKENSNSTEQKKESPVVMNGIHQPSLNHDQMRHVCHNTSTGRRRLSRDGICGCAEDSVIV